MKIGIVTVEKSANVGSFLQAYALQKVLEAWGHEVYFVCLLYTSDAADE